MIRFLIERRHRTGVLWHPDGDAPTLAEAERGVSNRRDLDYGRFRRETHDYRIIEQED